MPCLNCGHPDTIRAHLIPECFVMEVKVNRGEKHLIVHHGLDGQKTSITGVYDTDILCGPCDNTLGTHERYAFELLKGQRSLKPEPNTTVEIDPIDGDTMVRFAAGIAWKYAVTKPDFGRIDIGPYAEQLKAIALNNASIPPSIDLTMFRLIEFDGDAYHYRTPEPSRYSAVKMVRFSVGGFLFFLKIDKRADPGGLPTDCWMRGRTRIRYNQNGALHFEEGRKHYELAHRPAVSGFFTKMRQRRARPPQTK